MYIINYCVLYIKNTVQNNVFLNHRFCIPLQNNLFYGPKLMTAYPSLKNKWKLRMLSIHLLYLPAVINPYYSSGALVDKS